MIRTKEDFMQLVNEGQLALVTGAGTGIGRAIAEKIASQGASVIVSDLDPDAAGDACKGLSNPSGKALHRAEALDVTKKSHISELFARLRGEYSKLDILINNAGVSTMNPIWDLSEEEWDFNFNVNIKGMFLVSQAAFPMMKQSGGVIVNTASMAAVKAAPLLAHYTASKFAVIGFTKSAAIEFAPFSIRVNCVCPGYVKTGMQDREIVWEGKLRNMDPLDVANEYIAHTPLGRMCTPADVAQGVGFLISPAAGFITGEAMNIAGGANIV
jgi:NAD(P)-dependent dehydrogenase (short-subunit alcohol dehydrogenase family)